jgi:uncharacterized RDD family membrane protein YckC
LISSGFTAPSSGGVESGRIYAAPLLRRFASLCYEALLYAALVLIAGFLTVPLVSLAPSGPHALRIPDLPAKVLSFALVFGLGALYYTWSWTGGRRTLPMKTWRLWLVRADGTVPGTRTALLRYFAAWIGPALALLAYVALRDIGAGIHALWLIGFNYLWAFVDPDRRFLHDRLAGTGIVGEASVGRAAVPPPADSADPKQVNSTDRPPVDSTNPN